MLEIKNLNVSFDEPLFINQSLAIKNNCMTLIVGESGCGKTTLLYRLGLICDDCDYYLDGQNISALKEHLKAGIRRYNIGFVWQDYSLYDHFNVYENMQYWASLSGKKIDERKAQVYLDKVHLDISLTRSLYGLSSGQKQRLAIACALIKDPAILILDEPTSALDQNNVEIIFEVLNELKEDHMIIVTSHNKKAYKYADEVIEINDGIIKKVKSCDREEKPVRIKEGETSLPLKTYTHYIKKQYHTSKNTKRLLALVNVLGLMFCLFIGQVLGYYEDKSKSVINVDSPGQIYIAQNNIDKGSFKDALIYPYYENEVMLLGNVFDVIPYFKETNIADMIWTDSAFHANGFYFSYQAYLAVKNRIVPTSTIDFETLDSRAITLNYNGILLPGADSLLGEKESYIMLEYQQVNKLFQNTNLKGYCLFCDNYELFESTISKAIDLGYSIKVSDQFDAIVSYVKMLETMRAAIIALTLLLSIIGLNFIYGNYMTTREKEMALLMSHGLTNSNIIKLFYLDSVFLIFLSFLTVLVITCLLQPSMVMCLSLIEVIMLVSILAIIILKVRQTRPEQILRQ